MLFIVQVNLFALDVAPAVCPNLIAVHVAEYVRFITATVNVELIEEADEAMVCARLRRILRI